MKNGKAGASGQGDQTCNDCHSGGAAPAVQLTGPITLDAGATGTYRLVIAGGAAKVGGLGVSVDDPGVALSSRSDTVRVVGGTQLVHNAPVPFTDGSLAFEFDLTAPTRPTTLTIYAAGNSCDGDGHKTGDQAATTTLKVSITGGVGSGGTPDSQPGAVPQTGCSYASAPTATCGFPLLLCLLLAALLRACLRSAEPCNVDGG